ncbi:MAG: hypothetical protein J5978_07030 [Spirochaetaceae bacterium]|nr:hypothetical protein [Spirochaetaceae bacterium]
MNFTKYNKNQFEKIEWSKKTEGFSFKKIKDLYEEGVKRVQVFGFFFTKSENYGLQPNAILNDCILNLPTHQKDTISEMLKDEDCVKAINNGECTLSFREYQSKFNKICYEIDFENTQKATDTQEAQPPIF